LVQKRNVRKERGKFRRREVYLRGFGRGNEGTHQPFFKGLVLLRREKKGPIQSGNFRLEGEGLLWDWRSKKKTTLEGGGEGNNGHEYWGGPKRGVP